ncbi:hypothetical protein BOSE46_80823 [Bosea sp. 46]|nr:hypothetical protein BOSE46_80823 [Bosea sp. 46]VXB26645.1 hypothetical protein BOSE125_130348 [Bosea sp. 125]
MTLAIGFNASLLIPAARNPLSMRGSRALQGGEWPEGLSERLSWRVKQR